MPNSGVPMTLRVHLFETLYEDIKANEPMAKGVESEQYVIKLWPLTVEAPELNRQHWRSYLSCFRQFWSPGEPTSVAFLLKHLPRYIDRDDLRARLRTARRAWLVAGRNGWLPEMKLNGVPVTGHMADLYLNAMFHSDPVKTTVWHALGPEVRRLIEVRFRLFESEARDVYIELRKVIKEASEAGVLLREPLDWR